ncbi:MAG: tRNA pseudouridine synthase A [Bacteroidota bacterium]
MPGIVSVQETIEAALHKIFKTPVAINGCGRTDTGVHATQYFFHTDLPDFAHFDLRFRLNKVLPTDISVFDIFPFEGQPHARFDCFHRTYDYFIHSSKDPFMTDSSALYELEGLDFGAMATAAKLLPLYNDYKGFCRTPDKHEHHICRVSDSILYTNPDQTRLRFHIASNRYLKGMIRILVSKLLEIGQGSLAIEQFEQALKTGIALPEAPTAYARGLYLSKVTYPYLDLPARPAAVFNGEWVVVEAV